MGDDEFWQWQLQPDWARVEGWTRADICISISCTAMHYNITHLWLPNRAVRLRSSKRNLLLGGAQDLAKPGDLLALN